jgi:hypothetical protein
MTMLKRNLLTLAIFSIAIGAQAGRAGAQNVYRCGESYSQQPCAGGAVVPTDDARSPAQRAQANAAAQRDKQAAEGMEKARLKQEGKAAPASTPAPRPEPAAEVPLDRTLSTDKPKKPHYFRAVAPKKPADKPVKKKTKAAKKKAASDKATKEKAN